MVFPAARLFRVTIWCPSRGGDTREAGSIVAERLRSIGLVRTRFGEDGGKFDRRRARGVLNPCAQELKARTGRFLRENLISDHGLFSSYEGQHGSANGQDSLGLFQGCTGLWTAGCWLARRLHQLKASTTMDLGISIFLISV